MNKVNLRLLFLGLLVMACQHSDKGSSLGGGQLAGTSWTLISLPDQKVGKVEISISFEKDKLNGKAVCNRYFSTYQVEKSSITIQAIGSTKMLCPDRSELEVAYFDLLKKAKSYTLDSPTELHLQTSSGPMIFKKSELATTDASKVNMSPFEGTFVSLGYPNRYWQSLTVYSSAGEHRVAFSAADINGQPGCRYEALGAVKNDTLFVPMDQNEPTQQIIVTKDVRVLKVATKNFEDRLGLMQFCSGGGSLIGTYYSKPLFTLDEQGIGSLALSTQMELGKEHLLKKFPELVITEQKGQQDGPEYDYLSVAKSGSELFRVNLGNKPTHKAKELSSVIINSPELVDRYGVRKNVSVVELMELRPGGKLTTGSHFHTTVYYPNSHISYQICCNTNGPDKTDWTMDEVKNWRVQSIIWDTTHRNDHAVTG